MVEAKVKLGFAVLLLAFLLGSGAIAFHYLETYPSDYWDEGKRGLPWTHVDSFYFSAMTLTTIGFGDLVPRTDISKIFTVFYAILGVALVLYVLGVIARWYVDRSQQFEEHEIARLRHLLNRGSLHNKDEEKK